MHDPRRSRTAIYVVCDGEYGGDHEKKHKQRIDGEVTIKDEHPGYAAATHSTH